MFQMSTELSTKIMRRSDGGNLCHTEVQQ